MALLLLLLRPCLTQAHGAAAPPALGATPLPHESEAVEPLDAERWDLGERSRRNIWGFAALRDLAVAVRRSLVMARRPPKRMVKRVVRRIVRRPPPPHHGPQDMTQVVGQNSTVSHEGPRQIFVLLAFLLGMLLLFVCFYCLESAHMNDSRYSSYSTISKLDASADASMPGSWRGARRIRGGLFGKSTRDLEVRANVLTTWLEMLRDAMPFRRCTAGCRSDTGCVSVVEEPLSARGEAERHLAAAQAALLAERDLPVPFHTELKI